VGLFLWDLPVKEPSMADPETEQYGELVDRLADEHPVVPHQVVEEQVAHAVEGTHLFGEGPTTADLVETIANENVTRVERAVLNGADLSDTELGEEGDLSQDDEDDEGGDPG
jgi:hypothetical protein